MNSFVRRHPATRWAAPVLALGVIGATQLPGRTADAAASLPDRTPQQLVTAALQADVPGFSGTVRSSADLGLPALPEAMSPGGSSGVPLELLSGEHTMKVWWAKRTGARVALLGDQSETDAIVNRTDAWLWNSADRSVAHLRLPAGHHGMTATHKTARYTPQQVADWVLRQVGPTTAVSSSANVTVAGRPAYDLVLTPRDRATKVASVHLAIDATTSMPLQVKVFGTGSSTPALQVGFTSISYAVPAASTFTFTPPAGAKVETARPHRIDKSGPTGTGTAGPRADHGTLRDLQRPGTVVGSGWSSVWVGTVPAKALADQRVTAGLGMLPVVSGAWGKGHLLDTALFSAVVTDDGRVAAGLVAPATLYAALGAR